MVGMEEALDAEEEEGAGEPEAAVLPVARALELAAGEGGGAEESTLALAPAVAVTVRVALWEGEEVRGNCTPGRLVFAGAVGVGTAGALMGTRWDVDSVKVDSVTVELPVAEGEDAEE